MSCAVSKKQGCGCVMVQIEHRINYIKRMRFNITAVADMNFINRINTR